MNILVCYDGSWDAEAAVKLAGSLFDGATTLVLTVWEGFSEVSRHDGSSAALDSESSDEDCAAAALRCAEEGTGRARAAGLVASSRTIERSGAIWETILEVADEVQADMIVIGTRGLTGMRSLLAGSVSRAVLAHSKQPVLVVPSFRGSTSDTSDRASRYSSRSELGHAMSAAPRS